MTLDGGVHVTLLVETPKGYANLCRLLTAAHAGTRPKDDRAAPAGARPAAARGAHEGLVCLSGCARYGLAVRDPNAAARLAADFGRDRFYVELQRPYERGDARRNAALRDLAETLACPPSRPATCTRTTNAARRYRTCSSRSAAARRSTAASGSGGATTSPSLLRRPRWLERFPDDRDAVARSASSRPG